MNHTLLLCRSDSATGQWRSRARRKTARAQTLPSSTCCSASYTCIFNPPPPPPLAEGTRGVQVAGCGGVAQIVQLLR
jgi:hypothetical protein